MLVDGMTGLQYLKVNPKSVKEVEGKDVPNFEVEIGFFIHLNREDMTFRYSSQAELQHYLYDVFSFHAKNFLVAGKLLTKEEMMEIVNSIPIQTYLNPKNEQEYTVLETPEDYTMLDNTLVYTNHVINYPNEILACATAKLTYDAQEEKAYIHMQNIDYISQENEKAIAEIKEFSSKVTEENVTQLLSDYSFKIIRDTIDNFTLYTAIQNQKEEEKRNANLTVDL